MSATERRRIERSSSAVYFAAALLAVTAVACGGADGSPMNDSPAVPATVVSASGAAPLLELQSALPVGNEAGWYAHRLAELDYEIVRLRQERDGVSVVHARKAGHSYEVRVAADANDGIVRSVEIAPVAAAEEAAVVASAPEAAAEARASSSVVTSAPPAAEPAAQPAPEPVRELAAPPAAEPVAQPAPEPVREPAVPPVAGPAPAPEPYVAPPLPEPRAYTVRVPSGTTIAARLDGELSSGNAEVGDGFVMHVTDAVWVDGVEVLPAGAQVWGYVAEVERAGRPNKGGRLVLATESVQVDGETLALDAIISPDGERLEGRDSAREDIKEVAIGAGLGGLVGGLLGGKKGVLVGVLAGGGGTFVATKGEEVEIPRDAPLSLELRRDLNVTFADR